MPRSDKGVYLPVYRPPPPGLLGCLSTSEREVVLLAARNWRSEEIAKWRGLSLKTIQAQRFTAFSKLKDRYPELGSIMRAADLTVLFLRAGLIALEDLKLNTEPCGGSSHGSPCYPRPF